MFAGFTEAACEVVGLAQTEAEELGSGYVGAEHILLGLLREPDGVGAQVLTSFGITLEDARDRLLKRGSTVEEPPDGPYPGPFVRLGRHALELRFAPRAQLVLEMAVREALTLGSSAIDTEHILLGMSSENESVAMRLLADLDAELPHPEDARPDREFDLEIRNAVIRRLSDQQEKPAPLT